MDDCEPGLARYQSTANIQVDNQLMVVWEVRCLPPSHEVATLVMAGKLVGEVDGTFPRPVVIPVRCCGQGG